MACRHAKTCKNNACDIPYCSQVKLRVEAKSKSHVIERTPSYDNKQLLKLMIHSRQCDDSGCRILNCSGMKKVYEHIVYCKDGNECKVACCIAARQIFIHCTKCRILN